MALSGSVKFLLKGPSATSSYDRYIVMDWSATQNVAGCYSTISYTLRTDKGGTVEAQEVNIRYAVNATTATSSSTVLYHKEYDYSDITNIKYVQMSGTFASGSFRVNHTTAGEGSVAFYCGLSLRGGNIYSGMFYTQTASLTLDTIPTVSTLTCSTVDVGRYPTISIVKPVSTFQNTIRYEFGSLSGTIVTKTTATTYNSWMIPLEFLGQITNSKYGEGTLYCDTYTSSGTFNGTSSTTFRVNVPNSYGPTLDPTFKDVNSKTVALTGDSSKIIQYFSSVQYDTGAFATTGATVKSHKVTNGGQSKSTATGTFYNVESNTFVVSATDSRGYTTTETHYLTMVPYIKLTSNIGLAKVDTSSGYVALTLRGNFFGGGFGVVDNQTTVSYRYKLNDGAWSDWTNVVYNIYNDEYQALVEFTNLDYKGTYVYQARAVDKLMSVESSEVVVKVMPVFDWGPDDFTFNVPVTIEGDLTVTGTISSLTEQTLGAADFIVDQGTITTGSGNSTANWVYRKWDSGIAECWCRKHVSTAVNTAWGNLFVSGALSYTNITWGVDFIDIPVANITIAPNASGAFLIAGGSTSLTKDNTGGYEIARGSALASAGNFYINYYGIGKWK